MTLYKSAVISLEFDLVSLESRWSEGTDLDRRQFVMEWNGCEQGKARKGLGKGKSEDNI